MKTVRSLGLVLGIFLLYPAMLQAKRAAIEGVDGAVQRSLQAALSIARLPDNAVPRLVRRRHAAAIEELSTALRAFGYYQPTLRSRLDHAGTPEWQAVYTVEPGPRSRWAEIRIEIQPDLEAPWLEPLHEAARRLSGRPVDHRDYNALKSALLDAATAAGFLDARLVLAQLLVDVPANSAAIALRMELGPRYRFGKLRINQPIVHERFLQQFNPVVEGEYFSADTLLDLRLRLSDLGYFSDVEVATERNAELGRVDITIDALPLKPQRWQLGAGYGTDTGPRVLGAVEFRYLNGYGHKFLGDARVSEVKIDLSGRYVMPTGPRPGADFSFRSQRREEKLGDTETITLRNGLSRNLISGPRLWHYYLNYEYERFAFSDGRQRTDLITPGISLTLRSSDDLLSPTRGYTVFLDMHGAHDSVLSSTSFFQARAEARWITPISARSRLLLRGQIGANWLDDPAELPASQRFFAGGDNSIRGYDYRKVAPRNAQGEIVGGRYLQTASIEFDRMLWRDYGAAVFYDIGAANNQWGDDLVRSVGIGFRWRTPVGTIRADVAHPFDDPDSRFQLHIGIGGEL